MAQKFLSDLKVAAGLVDSAGALGTSGQVLSSTGTNVAWSSPIVGTTIIYKDSFAATDGQTVFTLANTVDSEDKTQVYIDGAYQSKGGYTVSGITLTFDTGLAEHSEVEVMTFSTATANNAASAVKLDTFTGDGSDLTFVLSEAVVDEKVTQVYINGVYQNKSTYSIDSDLVTLRFGTGNAPPNSSAIEVISFKTITSTDGTLTATTFFGDLNGTINTATTATTQTVGDNTTKVATTAFVKTGLDLKANIASPTFTGTVAGITKAMVGLTNAEDTSDADKPVSTAGQTALDLKANIAGPTFTGIPAAPTASAGTNTTQLATTAFVTTGIANIVDSSPATLDTLNELAAALGDDPNFATTVATSIGTKLPLAGGTLTGALSVTNGRINLNGNASDSKAIMSLGDATYPTATIGAFNTGGTVLIAGQSGTGMTIGTTGAATFSSLFPVLTVQGTVSAPHIGSLWSVSANQDGVGRTIIGTAGQGRAMYFENNGDIVIPNNSLSGTSATFSGTSGIGVTVANTNYAIGGAYNSFGNLNIYTTNAEAQNMGGSLTFGGTGAGGVYSYGAIYGKKESTGAGSALGYLAFATDDNNNLVERMRITSGGNVGIGTDSPYSKLQVGDPEQTSSAILTIASRYGATNPILNFRSGHPDNSNVWNMAQIHANDDANYNGRLEFKTATSNQAAPDTKMVIKATGNVGIGTTSPYTKLQVDGGNISVLSNSTTGTDGASDVRTVGFGFKHPNNTVLSALINTTPSGTWGLNLHFNTRASNAVMPTIPAMTIDGSGNVGIGTVTSTVNSLQKYLSITDNYNVGIILNDTRAASAFELYMAGSMFYINYGTSNKFNIDGSTGNVGIGTSSPTEKLEVAGAVRVGRKVLGWYQVTVPDNTSYWHIKTSLWSGGSPNGNTQYTMSLLHAELYSYAPLIREGRQGWHNWSGTQYNIVNTGNIWSNPYTSSNGYVVLVLNTSGSYIGLNIDWSQVYGYPYVDVYVQAASGSSSTTGVY